VFQADLPEVGSMSLSAIPLRVARPLYSFAEADRLAGVSRGTARRWLKGYAYKAPDGLLVQRPPITTGIDRDGAVSFIDLIEVVAIGRLKALNLPLGEIRKVVTECQTDLGHPRPLTSLKFKTDGKEIFVSVGDHLLGLRKRRGQQAWNDVLAPFLDELDYRDAHASRWWPLGKHKPIVVDPDYGFGLPVVDKSGVRTEIILERSEAGDSPDQIADDFNLNVVDVEEALLYEKTRAA
jgi:uncharacterized protein (DUF433 family)